MSDDPILVVVEGANPGLVMVEPRPAPKVLMLAPRGPRGPVGPGAGDSLAPIDFLFNEVSPRVVYTLPQDAFLSEMKLVITAPFNGTAPQLLVRTGTGVVLMSTIENDPTFASTYETTPAKSLLENTQLVLEITPGEGATSGAGKLLFNLN